VLDRQGFFIVPRWLTAEAVADLRDAVAWPEGAAGTRLALGRQAEVFRHTVGRLLEEQIRPVLGSNAVAVRAVAFDKTADANWKVAWHQDLFIAVAARLEAPGFSAWSTKDGAPHTQPPIDVLARMLTVRLHLDECGPDNGPLRLIAGSHRLGKLGPDAIVSTVAAGPEVTCTAGCGDALLMRPLVLHASSVATAPGRRRVLHIEFAAASLPAGLSWFESIG
jgi:ectoine hydroxylase-related dioxygenase (phytanoyl-CoA dioxygenase family)